MLWASTSFTDVAPSSFLGCAAEGLCTVSPAGALDDLETLFLVTHVMDGGQCAFSVNFFHYSIEWTRVCFSGETCAAGGDHAPVVCEGRPCFERL